VAGSGYRIRPLPLWGGPLVSVTLVDLFVSCVCSLLYIPGSGFLVSVRLLRDVLELHYAHVVSPLSLYSGIALIVFYTSVGTLRLCHIGNIVDNLVLEHIYVFVIVCVGMCLVKEF
jgi:hypothetical protein